MTAPIRKIGSVLAFEIYDEKKLDLAEDLREEFHAVAKQAVSDSADILLLEVDRLLSLRRGSDSTTAPAGEPPEYDTTALLRSWERIPARVKGNVAQSGIKSDSEYAIRAEYGGTDKRGIRTLPHPYLRPAMASTESEIDALLRERLA